jgi:hypothetical protein
VLVGKAVIASNPLANESLGGLVAAVGEVRDSFLPFVASLYAMLSAKNLKLPRLVAPLAFTIGVILLKALLQITESGRIWSNDAEFRFINSTEAITLVLLAFLLPFLRSSGTGWGALRLLAFGTFVMAMVANHRSVWLCTLLAVLAFLPLVASGRLRLSRNTSNRVVYFLAIMLAIGTGSAVLFSASSEVQGVPGSVGLGHRLLAITDPEGDATASWRQELWQARINQVGDDWFWGRQLGDRRLTLVNLTWVGDPDHNGYVTAFELGGVLLLGLVLTYWGALAARAMRRLRAERLSSDVWQPALALVVIVIALGFAISYDFTSFGPALATLLPCGFAPTSRLALLSTMKCRTGAIYQSRTESSVRCATLLKSCSCSPRR